MKLYNELGVDHVGNQYLTYGLNTAQSNGSTVIGYSNFETGRLIVLKTITKATMPQAWQDLYASATGTVVEITLCVRDYGSYIEVYANGDYVCSYDDSAYLGICDGKGYGIRSSADNMSYVVGAREMKAVALMDSEQTIDTLYMATAMNLPQPSKEGFVFIGWYLDSELTQAVNDGHLFSEDCEIYAKWETADYTITLVSNCENSYDSISYVGGTLQLPTPTTTANRVFTGWYYDDELTQLVDQDNPVITQSVSLYAGWRLPTHYNMTIHTDENGNNSYECATTVIAIVDETPYDMTQGEYTEYNAAFDFVKGASSSSLFFAFRMTGNTDDNRSGVGWHMLNFGIQMSTGKYGFGYIDNGGYVGIIFASPASDNGWLTYFNGVAKGDTVTCAITVKDYGTKVECYINGYLIYTYSGEYLTKTEMQGIGYGIFTKNISTPITYYGFSATLISEDN